MRKTCTPKETYTPNYIHLGVTSLLNTINILRYLIIQYLIFDSKSNKQREDYVERCQLYTLILSTTAISNQNTFTIFAQIYHTLGYREEPTPVITKSFSVVS